MSMTQRSDPALGKQYPHLALEMFRHAADRWELAPDDRCRLLGVEAMPAPTLAAARSAAQATETKVPAPHDTLELRERLSFLNSIANSVDIGRLPGLPDGGVQWLRRPA